MKAFLSAGHHLPFDPGAVSGAGTANDPKLIEHVVCREIVDLAASRMSVVEPVMVPAIPLSRKISFVNHWSRAGDVAVEIHLNAFHDASVRGVEVFYHSGSTTGRKLAQVLLGALEALNLPSRGLRTGQQSQHGALAWLSQIRAWSALIEVEFVTNLEARHWLTTHGVEETARAIAITLDDWP